MLSNQEHNNRKIQYYYITGQYKNIYGKLHTLNNIYIVNCDIREKIYEYKKQMILAGKYEPERITKLSKIMLILFPIEIEYIYEHKNGIRIIGENYKFKKFGLFDWMYKQNIFIWKEFKKYISVEINKIYLNKNIKSYSKLDILNLITYKFTIFLSNYFIKL